jgi:glycosyltransferase involved in cell wall biosynthesis
MILLTTNQIHVLECDRRYYNASDVIINYDYMSRYKRYCDQVMVLMRSRSTDQVDPSLVRVDGDSVTVVPLPDPRTPIRGLMGLPGMVLRVLATARKADYYYLKLPDVMATMVGLTLWLTGRKYTVEVVADCRQGILLIKRHMPLVRFYAWLFEGLTRFLVKHAECATYISRYLQERYPNKSPDRQWLFCSVEMTEEDIGRPRQADQFTTDPFKLIAAGRFSAEKGHIDLVRAFKTVLLGAGRPVELHLLGDGPERGRLENEARILGLADHIKFPGYVPHGPELYAYLDQAQLYCLPSLTEGMGRGLIEAMARGLPCVGSAVGGVPEYLAEDCLFPSSNPEAMAQKILCVMHDPERLAQMSQVNIQATQAFTPERLKAVKDDFWQAVHTHCRSF